jgi:hydroxymethylglutaryl-CoA reductase (NADPH)
MKRLLAEKKCDLMNNSEILFLLKLGLIRPYALEKILQDATRGVVIRRKFLGEEKFKSLPYQNYDFEIAAKACCENIVGYVPIPLGIVGPILVDGKECSPLLATTEGALLASVNRGCKVIKLSGGAQTSVFRYSRLFAFSVKVNLGRRCLELHAFHFRLRLLLLIVSNGLRIRTTSW